MPAVEEVAAGHPLPQVVLVVPVEVVGAAEMPVLCQVRARPTRAAAVVGVASAQLLPSARVARALLSSAKREHHLQNCVIGGQAEPAWRAGVCR